MTMNVYFQPGCTSDCPHKAAVNDGPWQSFPNRADAERYVARNIKRITDSGWIRCVVHEPILDAESERR